MLLMFPSHYRFCSVNLFYLAPFSKIRIFNIIFAYLYEYLDQLLDEGPSTNQVLWNMDSDFSILFYFYLKGCAKDNT